MFKKSRDNRRQRPQFHGKQSSHRGKQKQLDSALFIKRAAPSLSASSEVSSTTFAQYPLEDKLKRNIADKGYITPTPIQEQTISLLLEGKDVLGIANTGTGKTAAFLIPLINKAYKDKHERVLIVTPTRELAMQIVDDFRSLAKGMQLEPVLCIGGVDIRRQEKRLAYNPHFVIGTPGRLKDLIQRNKLDMSLLRNVVLDEVDRMVDIGFLKEVQYLVSLLPKKRQSLFFSATIGTKEKAILSEFVQDPVTVSVKQQATSENVEQDIIRLQRNEKKIDRLHDLLTQDGFDKVLIFGKTKWGIEKLTKDLLQRGFRVTAIHGNKSQGQRRKAIEDFREERVQILLATDVASRGLDIENVTHVINYDPPATYEDYIHRIGRTGRAGKMGTAYTFVE